MIGIDLLGKMLIKARNTYPYIEFYKINAVDMRLFKDNSFDIVTASFVLHGPDRYNRILSERVRVARVTVVVHDFSQETQPFLTRFGESMERSYYKDFQ